MKKKTQEEKKDVMEHTITMTFQDDGFKFEAKNISLEHLYMAKCRMDFIVHKQFMQAEMAEGIKGMIEKMKQKDA